jgi:hypothetical protein
VRKLSNCSAGKGLEKFNAILSIAINSDNVIKIIVLIILKSTWARAVLLVFLEEPSDNKTDVLKAPIFKTKYYIIKII